MLTEHITRQTPRFALSAAIASIVIGSPLIASASVSYDDIVLADGAVAYYRLGETSGTTASEEVSGQDGTYVNNPTLGVPGVNVNDGDTAVELSPTDNSVVELPSMSFTGTAFTVEAWFTLDSFGVSTDSSLRTLIGYTDGDSGFDLRVTSDGAIQYVLDTGGFTTQTTAAGTVAADGTAYHIVATYDANAAAGIQRNIYLDGVLISSIADTGNVDIDATDTITIGRNGNAGLVTSRIWDGAVDEVALYDTALTSEQVEEHFEAGTTFIPEPATAVLAGAGLFLLGGRRRSVAS